MASGRLGVVPTTANQYVQLYEMPTESSLKWAVANIRIVNTQDNNATVRVAITNNNTGTPNPEEHIAYDVLLKGKSAVVVLTCETISPGEKILVYSDTSNLAVRASGLEQVV